jgi:hypothetical protein
VMNNPEVKINKRIYYGGPESVEVVSFPFSFQRNCKNRTVLSMKIVHFPTSEKTSFFLNRILKLHVCLSTCCIYFILKIFLHLHEIKREFIPQTKNNFPNIFQKNLFQAHI